MRSPSTRFRLKSDIRKSKHYLIYPTDLKRSSWTYRDKKKILFVLENYGEDVEKLIESLPTKSPLEIFTFLGNYKDYCSALNRHYYINEQPESFRGWISACDQIVPSQTSGSFQNNVNVLGIVINDIAENFEVTTPQLKEISNIIDLKKIIVFLADIVNLKPVGNLKPFEALVLLSIIESLENKTSTFKYFGPQMVSHALKMIKLGASNVRHYFDKSSNILKEARKISMVKAQNGQESNSCDMLKIAEDDIVQSIKSSYEKQNMNNITQDLQSKTTEANTIETIQNSHPNSCIESYLPCFSQETHTIFKSSLNIKVEKALKNHFFGLNPLCLPPLDVSLGLDNFSQDLMPSSQSVGSTNSSMDTLSFSKDHSNDKFAGFKVYGKSKSKQTN